MREGWAVRPLADVCEIKPSKREVRDRFTADDPVSFVPMNDLGIRQKWLLPKEERPFGSVAGSYTYFADGDVLLAKITPCFENGKLGIARGLTNGVGFGSSEFVVLRPTEALDAEFLFYFLSQDSYRDAGARVMSGAVGHKRVPNEFIQSAAVPLPPLPEQKRIVAILDEAFAGIATAVANTEKNLVNARELFDGTAEAIFLSSKDWESRSLSEMLESGWIDGHLDGNHGSEYPRKSEFVSRGVPYISANCLRNDAVEFQEAKFLTPERAASIRKGVARDGDVLFAHNATVGPVALLRTKFDKVILSTSLTYYRCNPEHIAPNYLAHFMRSPIFRKQYESVMRQSTRNQVPITMQRRFVHLIPPIGRQREVAEQLDSLRYETERLESNYQGKLIALNGLKQSLLQKAFSGELTATPREEIEAVLA